MQIVDSSQCFSRKKMIKLGMKSDDFVLTYTITTNYKHCSYLAYLHQLCRWLFLREL